MGKVELELWLFDQSRNLNFIIQNYTGSMPISIIKILIIYAHYILTISHYLYIPILSHFLS